MILWGMCSGGWTARVRGNRIRGIVIILIEFIIIVYYE